MEIHAAPILKSNYEVITLSDKSLRDTECVACCACNKCLAGKTIISLESRKFCWQCFEKVFGQRCLSCQKLINGKSQMNFIYYNNQVWHKDCFKCCSCNEALEDRAFVQHKSSIYCTKCRKY